MLSAEGFSPHPHIPKIEPTQRKTLKNCGFNETDSQLDSLFRQGTQKKSTEDLPNSFACLCETFCFSFLGGSSRSQAGREDFFLCAKDFFYLHRRLFHCAEDFVLKTLRRRLS